MEQVLVQIPTSNRRGQLARRVTVTTNDSQNRTVQLECESNIKSALVTEPTHVSFGKIDRAQGKQTKTVKIRRGDGGPLKPTIANTSGNCSVEAELREIRAGEEYELDLTLGPPWPNNRLNGLVQISTGVPEAQHESISAYASIDPRLQATPGRFMVPAAPGEELELKAALHWSGEGPGAVTDLTVSDPAIKAHVEGEPGHQEVVITVPADFDAPRQSGYVLVRTTDTAAPTLRIPIYYRGVRTAARTPAPATPATPAREQPVQPITPPVNQPPSTAER